MYLVPVQMALPDTLNSRKADWRVFPMLCFVFGLSLLDRTNISAAYIAGLATDLRLGIENRYNIALLVFFIGTELRITQEKINAHRETGYALFELPSNYVIRRIGARVWLPTLITAWGACVLGMGFVRDWRILTVLRALLGIFEAGLFPGAVYIIGSWYRQYETAKRVSIFYMAALLASGFGPIVCQASTSPGRSLTMVQFAYALSLISVGDGIYRNGQRSLNYEQLSVKDPSIMNSRHRKLTALDLHH
jgi:MFS family permease